MPEIRHRVRIHAARSVVYRAITEQAGLCAWWTPGTIARPEVGSTAEFKFGTRYHNRMEVVRLDPETAVEWECLGGDEEWIGTSFVFDLEGSDDDTLLRFTHGNWRESTDFFASCNYQWGYYLHSLKLYCETGAGTPFQPGD